MLFKMRKSRRLSTYANVRGDAQLRMVPRHHSRVEPRIIYAGGAVLEPTLRAASDLDDWVGGGKGERTDEGKFGAEVDWGQNHRHWKKRGKCWAYKGEGGGTYLARPTYWRSPMVTAACMGEVSRCLEGQGSVSVY